VDSANHRLDEVAEPDQIQIPWSFRMEKAAKPNDWRLALAQARRERVMPEVQWSPPSSSIGEIKHDKAA
jgi:hypothetical protein